MNQWQVELSAGGRTLGTINIRRGIFQGDCLSPLLFVLALIPLSMVIRRVKAGYDLASRTGFLNHLLFMVDLELYRKNEKQVDNLIYTVRVFSSDIAMEFGISKCAVLVMKRGNVVKCEGLEEEDGYKYLGILEA